MPKKQLRRLPCCSKCGSDAIGEIDTITGFAMISGVDDQGKPEWTGNTEVDWDSQRYTGKMRTFICIACSEIGSLTRMTKKA